MGLAAPSLSEGSVNLDATLQNAPTPGIPRKAFAMVNAASIRRLYGTARTL
jgi:hypothetical protein